MDVDKTSKIVIVGAGIFGLSLAHQLAAEGHQNVTVLDRHMPPVPDGSSNDISRVVRFDYADEDYMRIAHEAYQKWSQPRYKGIFHATPYVLVKNEGRLDRTWLRKTTAALDKHGLPWTKLDDAAAAREAFPTLTGELARPGFAGYYNLQAGWADAAKAVTQLRDDCIELGVSFISGHAGTVVSFDTDSHKKITAARTLAATRVEGDHFVLAAGAWTSSLVPMYNSMLTTGQVVGYIRLTESEMQTLKSLPIYHNCSTGWFNFPPHEETNLLKAAVHGWGYTRAPSEEERAAVRSDTSAPPLYPARQRKNFVPSDAESRLRDGFREILPGVADRPFEKQIMCWYTDTPTGDFIMDYHPDFANLFVAGGGSGHAFKFLPVLGEYTHLAFKRSLPARLAQKWRFRTEYQGRADVFVGDGSRGGPERRELLEQERARL